jgi:cytochrome c oxidase subunit II
VGRAQRGGPGLPFRGGRGGGSARDGHGGVGRVAKLVGLAALVVPVTTGCSVENVLHFGWPTGVTPQAETMRTSWGSSPGASCSGR